MRSYISNLMNYQPTKNPVLSNIVVGMLCCYGIVRVLLWYCQSVAMILSECCYDIVRVLLWHCQKVAMILSEYCHGIVICCYGIVRVLLWYCQSVAIILSECCLVLL